MRFPNYLTCTPSGVFLFRIRVPADLRGIIGRAFIKQRIGHDSAKVAQVEVERAREQRARLAL